MKRFVFALVLSAALGLSGMIPSVAEAQVVGRYSIEGQNPDGSRYAGMASVEKTGQTYRVIWIIDGARFVGTGIGSDDAIAITYRAGNETGVALLGREATGYGMVWAYAGGTGLGIERWNPR